jgi:hypothetical protein
MPRRCVRVCVHAYVVQEHPRTACLGGGANDENQA